MKRRYDLIVFDWDGTVMDSTAVISGSIQAACRDLDLPVPTDETARHVIGLGLQQALNHAVPSLTEAGYDAFVNRYRHHFLSQENAMPLFVGAAETIAELHSQGYWLAVATGKTRHGLNRAMQACGLQSYFHASRTADETHSKPHPAMLLEIMNELGITAHRALMVGDTTHDLNMAKSAGVSALGVTYGAHPPHHLSALQPLALLDSFTELRAWFKIHA